MGRDFGRRGIQIAAVCETRFAEVGGRLKKLVLYTLSSRVDAKVKRGVKQELAWPLK